MNVFFRVDAASDIGLGHYMRCLALAQAVKHNPKTSHFNICFVSRFIPASLKRDLAAQNFSLIEISCEIGQSEDALNLQKIAECEPGCIVVLDGYKFDYPYQRNFKKRQFVLFLFDDFGSEKSYEADIILNQTFTAKLEHYQSSVENSDCKCFLGEKYILLRKEFWPYIGVLKTVENSIKRVLVTIGGSDSNQVLQKIYQSFLNMQKPLEVCFLTGSTNEQILERFEDNEKALNISVSVLVNSSQISQLMSWADLVVCGGGSTAWELAFMGVPFMAVSSNLVEAQNVQALCNEGLGSYLGVDKEFSSQIFYEKFCYWQDNIEARRHVAAHGQQVIDGKGYERITNGLLE